MGFILIFTITPVLLLIIGLVFLKEKIWLMLLMFFSFPILIIRTNSYNEIKYSEFKRKYEFATVIEYNSLQNIESQIEYLNTVKWINEEINNAKKNYDSFWYGLFTDKRLTEYELINTIKPINLDN